MARLYAEIPLHRPKLRVGVMLDSLHAPQWVYQVIQSVEACGVGTVATVILNKEPSPAPSTLMRRIAKFVNGKSSARHFLWGLYLKLDSRTHPDCLKPFKEADTRPLFADATTLEITPLRRGSVHRFTTADVERVREQKLDVILRFGFNILKGDILTAAQHGIWSYHHGDNNAYRGGPAGFWEMYERNPVTGCVLQVLTETLDGGKVIYRSAGATQGFESLALNRLPLYQKCVPFVARCLRRLYHSGSLSPEPSGPPYRRPIFRTPTNAKMLWFMFRVVKKMLVARVQDRLRWERSHWFLAISRERPSANLLSTPLQIVSAPRGRFWADPFIHNHAGQAFLFFEDYSYAKRRGRISVMEYRKDGSLGEVRVALEQTYHLSYPFLFTWEGTVYLIPETCEARRIERYRAVRYPDKWELDGIMLDSIAAVDGTLFQHENRWYLFANVSENGGSTCDELFLFIADNPFGAWKPHPENPIVSDVRCARPAGALFIQDGTIFRPAQDCSVSYGSAIRVYRITSLSPETYSEQFEYEVFPPAGSKFSGTHTVSSDERVTVIDCKTARLNP